MQSSHSGPEPWKILPHRWHTFRTTGSFSRSSHRAATLAHGTPHRCAASTVASSQLGAITGTS